MDPTKTYPALMKGKKLMYVHGFGSSGQSGTVTLLRTLMPEATVVAPDLPLHPAEALALLRQTCDTEKPDLIIGTSMGGMYAEMLRGVDRILINPAFEMGDTMVKHNMVGKQTFQNPRVDGVQDFIVTKALVNEYKEITMQLFNGIDETERQRVTGLFGDEDTSVDTFDIFAQHYPTAALSRTTDTPNRRPTDRPTTPYRVHRRQYAGRQLPKADAQHAQGLRNAYRKLRRLHTCAIANKCPRAYNGTDGVGGTAP